jgi:alpha-glucosidase
MKLDLSFLPKGSFWMGAHEDGVNADRCGRDYKKVRTQMNKNSKIKILLASGGGWAVRIHS